MCALRAKANGQWDSAYDSHRTAGVPDDLAHASLRFGLGRFTTAEEIEYTIDEVARNVKHLRSLNPMYELEKAGAV